MGALDAVEWDVCVLEPVRNPEAERFLRKSLGFVPPGSRYFLDSAWLTRAYALLGRSQMPLRYAPPGLSEMIALVVSQQNSCRYCYEATRSLMRILGYPEERIHRLEEDDLSAAVLPVEQAALEFARRVSRGAPLATHRESQPLRSAGWGPGAVNEVAFLAAVNVFFNRMSTLPALSPAQMDFAGRWYVRLLRPLVAHRIRTRRATEPALLTPAQREGPFAAIVNALDGLPSAARLRAVIDGAWQSPALDRRTKALVFAVVARGLGCAVSEQEARRLLGAEGMPAEAIDQALAHLSGPALDPLDAAAASLARESVWYRPAQIQRHVRQLRDLLTPEQLVELIGVAALANMVCRLGVAVDVAEQPR